MQVSMIVVWQWDVVKENSMKFIPFFLYPIIINNDDNSY